MTHNTGNPARDAALDKVDTMMAERDVMRAEVQVIRDARDAIIAEMEPLEIQRQQLGNDIKAKIAGLGLAAFEKSIADFAKTIPGNKGITPDGTLALPE